MTRSARHSCSEKFLQPGLNPTVETLAEAVKCLGGGENSCSAAFLQPGLDLSTEVMTCLENEDSNACRAATFPVVSNSFLLFMMLVYYLAIQPLSSTTETRLSLPEMGAFFGLQWRTKFQLIGVQIAISLNIILFTSIDKGEISDAYIAIFLAAIFTQMLILIGELYAIKKSIQHRAKHGNVDHEDMYTSVGQSEVAEFMEDLTVLPG